MKGVVAIFLVVLAFARAIQNDDLLEQWSEFQKTYGKSYRSPVEAKKRLAIFKENLNEIEEHNSLYEQGKTSYTKAVNQFADWTKNEFMQYVNKGLANKPAVVGETFNASQNFVAPSSVDWRSKNVVTDVKNQAACGSCWAFSTTGSLEGQLGIKKSLVSLSEQNLMDCSTYNRGCAGGVIAAAFDYIKQYGIESESDYPYEGIFADCRSDTSKVVTKVSNYVNIPSGSETDLQEAVATIGPVSVAMIATPELQNYHSGVLFDQTCIRYGLNHGVLVVGYGTENDKEYYIIKNSWGSSWGEKGYFRLTRNKNNHCGIATAATYPVL